MDKKIILQNNICKITISEIFYKDTKTPDLSSYSKVYDLGEYIGCDLYKMFLIDIDLYKAELHLAFAGNYVCNIEKSAILENDILILMLNEQFFKIDVYTGSLILFKELDYFGCNIALYRVAKSFIIHGEIYITMLDNDFNELWKFSGNDIFITSSGNDAFILTNKSIKLCDFNGDTYELDFNGNETYSSLH